MEERPFLRIGIEVVITAAPQNSKWADCDRLSLIAVLLLLVPSIVIKSEGHLPIAGDTVIELVALPHHALIHAADTFRNKRLPVQLGTGIAVGLFQNLFGKAIRCLLGDELGGLNTIHNQAEFIRGVVLAFQPIAPRPAIVVDGNILSGI